MGHKRRGEERKGCKKGDLKGDWRNRRIHKWKRDQEKSSHTGTEIGVGKAIWQIGLETV